MDTEYNGYWFRSRLEAKWAVFFDALAIQWDYEPQDFVLGELGRYLPDFRLPGVGTLVKRDEHYFWEERDVWVEIKGDFPSLKECRKAQGLAYQTGQDVWIFKGSEFKPPWVDPTAPYNKLHKKVHGTLYYFFSPTRKPDEMSLSYSGDEEMMFIAESFGATMSQWQECPVCGDIFLNWMEGLNSHRCENAVRGAIVRTLETLDIKEPSKHAEAIIKKEALMPTSNTPKILEAYDQARQARFEFGESGPPKK